MTFLEKALKLKMYINILSGMNSDNYDIADVDKFKKELIDIVDDLIGMYEQDAYTGKDY